MNYFEVCCLTCRYLEFTLIYYLFLFLFHLSYRTYSVWFQSSEIYGELFYGLYENTIYSHENNMYSVIADYNVLEILIRVRWLIAYFRSYMSLLIFHLTVLSFADFGIAYFTSFLFLLHILLNVVISHIDIYDYYAFLVY